MTVGDVFLLVLVVGLLAYLLWALLAPERLG
jgi:K+-transporting ATPase KdpF subunit